MFWGFYIVLQFKKEKTHFLQSWETKLCERTFIMCVIVCVGICTVGNAKSEEHGQKTPTPISRRANNSQMPFGERFCPSGNPTALPRAAIGHRIPARDLDSGGERRRDTAANHPVPWSPV